MPSESILLEYRLRSFLPWLTSILLDVAVGGDVVQNPAQVILHVDFFYAKSVSGVAHCIVGDRCDSPSSQG